GLPCAIVVLTLAGNDIDSRRLLKSRTANVGVKILAVLLSFPIAMFVCFQLTTNLPPYWWSWSGRLPPGEAMLRSWLWLRLSMGLPYSLTALLLYWRLSKWFRR